MRYEDWTFREAEVRLGEHRELRQTAHEWTVREPQARAMIDNNGGAKQEDRGQPGKWRAVENGLAPRPSY